VVNPKSTMTNPPNADENRLEEIVAYLDGELSVEESARVERQLASDESYRQQLQSVERAWKALDELPLAIVDQTFSQTTMQMAVQAAEAEVQAKTAALPVLRQRRWLSTALAAAAAAALGFLVVRLALQDRERLLVADLPVIDNVDVYSQFERPDFLRTLRSEWGDQLAELGGDAAEAARRAARLRTVSDAALRDDWLRGLDPQERTNLRAKFNRFRDLPPQEQERLRELHEQIANASDAAELQQTMLAYHQWLVGLPPARQFELRNMPADERLRAIRRWADEMRDDALLTLSEDELKRLFRQLRRLRLLPTQPDAHLGREGDVQQAVLKALPPRARQAFQELPQRQKVARFRTWMRQAESLVGQIPQEELERFFAEDLDAETRAQLLSLPPGEMQQALRWRYRRQTGQRFGGPPMWPPPPGRERMGGPRPGPRDFGPPPDEPQRRGRPRDGRRFDSPSLEGRG